MRKRWNESEYLSQLEGEAVKGRGREGKNLTLFFVVSSEEPRWNYLPLQYHQSDSAPTYCSFLFIPTALLPPFRIIRYLLFLRSSRYAQPMNSTTCPACPAAIFYSPACFFLSTVFSPCVLCCWWATAKTLIPNTVWVRVHTRGAFTHPHPSDPLAKRKIFPWAMALSSFCACVWACEWERRRERAVVANTMHRYWYKVRSFGEKMTASSSHLIRVTARILGCLKVPQTPKILKITSFFRDPFSFCHAQTEWQSSC